MDGIRDFGTSLLRGFKDTRTWVGENIIGQDDSYSTRKQIRNRDYAVLGAGTGAVAGAAIGVVTGFNAQGGDSITEQMVHRDVLHPSLNGYSHWANPDTYQDCHTEGYGENRHEVCDTKDWGWYHVFNERISNRDVGDYTEPRFVHNSKWEPLLGGFLGALGGAVIGLGVGVGIAALRNALDKAPDEPNPPMSAEQRKDLTDFAGGSAIVGTVAGAGLGAWVGSRAGFAELGNQEVHTRSWMVPTTQSQLLGHIPRDYYEYNWGWGWPSSGYDRPETDPIYRQVPVYQNGQPTFHETSQEFRTNRYGPVMGGVLGGLMGAGIGLATGVAVGVGAKLIAEQRAQARPAPPNAPVADVAPGTDRAGGTVKRLLVMVLLLCLPLAADDTAAARAAAKSFLALVDAGKYSQAYKSTGKVVKEAVNEQSFTSPVQQVRAKLGAVKSRKFKKATPTDTLPSIPKGKYVVLEYTTDFANQKGVNEVITPMLEKDGVWRVAGYYLR